MPAVDPDREGPTAETVAPGEVNVAVRTSGVGSMPGVSAMEAAAISAGEFDIPFVAELPERGPGADMVGRAMALVHSRTGEFAAATTASGWQVATVRSGGEPGRVMRRGSSWLGEDLDALEANLDGFTGTVKVALAGPWTLAAAVEDRSGNRLLADPGACADLAGGLAVAAGELARNVHGRVPGASSVIVQVDEPLLPAVIGGRVRTASGRGRLPVPPDQQLQAGLDVVMAAIRAAGAVPGMHCCARRVPVELAARCGVEYLSLDSGAVGDGALEAMGRWWDRGGVLALGAVRPISTPEGPMVASGVARGVSGLWHRIGFGPEVVGPLTVLTPACGLAGATPAWARAVGGYLRRAARMLADVD
jgi:hypothetical protein